MQGGKENASRHYGWGAPLCYACRLLSCAISNIPNLLSERSQAVVMS